MKICITSGLDENPYCVALGAEVIRKCSVQPIFLVSSRWQRTLRASEWRRLARKMWKTHFFGPRHEPGPTDTAPIREYLKTCGAWSHSLSIAQFAKHHGCTVRLVPTMGDEMALRVLREGGFDAVVNAGGGVFTQKFIDSAQAPILNAHMGYLPLVRGMNALEWGILEGIRPTVTIHMITAKIDMGTILRQLPIPLKSEIDLSVLRGESLVIGIKGIVEVLGALQRGVLTGLDQAPTDGKQFFIMHPDLRRCVQKAISSGHIASFAAHRLFNENAL